jgi:hypothetical protein
MPHPPSHWLIPQGPELAAVQRGIRQGTFTPTVIPIPLKGQPIEPWQTALKQSLQQPCSGVLLMGVGGSLDPHKRVGDVVISTEVCTFQGEKHCCDSTWVKQIATTLPHSRLGTALCSDRVITQAQEKEKLGQMYHCEIVEMEGEAVAQVLEQMGLPWVMVRVISDDVQRDMPPIDRAIGEDGSFNGIALALSFLQQPTNALHFIQGSLQALSQLEKTAQALCH